MQIQHIYSLCTLLAAVVVITPHHGFGQTNSSPFLQGGDPGKKVSVIELRNYRIQPGKRDSFIRFFESNFVHSQEELGGFVPARFRVKGSEDHFCWIRGFENMAARSRFLPQFYKGAFWKAHREVANSMLRNNDNVYLLKPMVLDGDSLSDAPPIEISGVRPRKGIMVVDFFVANTKLPKLLQLFGKRYIPLFGNAGIQEVSFWRSEMAENDFPQLPVFQDKNLLVVMSFFPDEPAYRKVQKNLERSLPDDLRSELDDTITQKTTWILYPTAASVEHL